MDAARGPPPSTLNSNDAAGGAFDELRGMIRECEKGTARSTMTISPSKDCWSRYDIDASFRVLAEWLGPDFPRAMTFSELQWLSGAQEYRASGDFESWRG